MSEVHVDEDVPAATTRPPARVVPVRHPGRWVAAVLLLVLLAQFVQGAVRNKRFRWDVIGDYLFNSQVLSGVRMTIELTVVSMAVGIVLGVLVAVGRRSANPVVSQVCWLYVWFFRGVPVLVQVFVWFNLAALLPRVGFGIPFGGPQLFAGDSKSIITPFVAAVLGLGLSEAAYYSEIVRSGLLSVDEGQTEAAAALGMTRGLALRRIILPQAARVIIPPTGNEVNNMLKTTSLVSVIAVSDLLYSVQLIYASTYQVIPMLVVALIWYLVMTSVLQVGQYYLERYFAKGAQRALPPTPLQRVRLLSLRSPAGTA
ncbi:polar amino acid transport system permease protein [Motilibacter rhizosphaerae]|uniref:Polar amino acid transport system permease protein n=1 Tax=Motilibacter rhizosphaerae TaxID=598652 RepID=A0A4Q7NSE4_9ACTN|nr:amino acid ABC transporter permease [Motilibacter rhizosphaerae]RZS89874.1 polar amino acid transport system permease protein [Motilibacter rhizosphaerae]